MHHRVAAGQRRRDLPQRLDEGEVPRRDGGDHPDRLAQGVGEHEGAGDRQGVAGDLVGPAGEVAQRVDRGRQVDVARLEDRLAVVERLGEGELVDAGLQGVGDLVEQPAAVAGRGLLAPVAGERRVRRLDGAAGVGGRSRRHLAEDLLGGRVLGREGAPVLGLDPAAVDEQGRRRQPSGARLRGQVGRLLHRGHRHTPLNCGWRLPT